MKLVFSKTNRCCELFPIRYRSIKGFVRCLSIREPNEAAADEISANEANPQVFNYCLRPKPGETYWADLEIFNGFGAGERNWHEHIPSNLHCRKFRLVLDLRAYLAEGYQLSEGPDFSYYPHDVPDHSLCSERAHGALEKCVEPLTPGVWTWEVKDVRAGVVDVRWDVIPKGVL